MGMICRSPCRSLGKVCAQSATGDVDARATGWKSRCAAAMRRLASPDVRIRPEEPSDHEAVRGVHLAAFGAAHGAVVADLTDDLRSIVADGAGLALVAEADGQVVGHVMFTRSRLDAPQRLVDVQVLSPLGVLPAWQRRGVGSALVRQGLETLAARTVPVVFLEGAPGYYPRFGFAPGRDLGFGKPSVRIPDAAFQALRLPAYEPWMTGTVVYAEAFWRHDAVGLRE